MKLRKCKVLLDIEKDEGGNTAGPVSISSEGYVNPMFSTSMKDFPEATRKKKGKKKYLNG